jgi:ubiquitin-conjugating enzyme E2 Z
MENSNNSNNKSDKNSNNLGNSVIQQSSNFDTLKESKRQNVISKETVTRLLKDVRNITKNPLNDNGIYYQHDDTDMMKGYAMIEGPTDTPYFSGFYFFEIAYPTDYPHSPPVLKFCTNGDGIRFNPNLYTNGKVCISLLNTWRGEQWTSCQTISTVLLTLCTLLCEEPFLNEPGITEFHQDYKNYHKIIEFKNIDIAIVKMMQKDDKYFLPQFEIFCPIMKEIFQKNKDKIKEILEERKNNGDVYKTVCYNMYVFCDYKKLYKSFQDLEKEYSI